MGASTRSVVAHLTVPSRNKAINIQPRLSSKGPINVFRHRLTAASTLLVLISCNAGTFAEETAVLVDDLTGARSQVSITADLLQVTTDDGFTYVYERDAEHDGRQSYCYYNADLDQALRWPLENNAPLQILKPGAVRYQRSEMRITRRRGTIDDNVPAAPNVPGAPQADELLAYLYDVADGSAPRGGVQLAQFQQIDDGVFNAELIAWDYVERLVTVTVPYTEEVVINGRVQRETRSRVEERTIVEPRLALSTLTLNFEQMTAFLPNGTRLDNNTLQQLIAGGATAVMVPDLAPFNQQNLQLDQRIASLLDTTAPIIAYDSQANPSPVRFPAPGEAAISVPSTPITFCGARISRSGDLEISNGHYELREQTYTVQVPVTETRIVNGRTIEVATFVEEQRTRTAPVWHSTTVPYAPGQYELYELSGRPLAPDEAAETLSLPQTVIFLENGEQLDPWYRRLLRSRTLVAVTLEGDGSQRDPNWTPFAEPN